MIFSLIFLLISLSPAWASFISINTEMQDIEIQELIGQSEVTIRNQGDEAAYDVSISIKLPQGLSAEDIFIGRLEAGGSYKGAVTIETQGEVSEGVYPSVLLVNYKDANSYPFSALAPFQVVYRKRTSSNVFGILEEVTLSGDKRETITLSIKNPDQEPHDLGIRLYLPKELNVDEPGKSVTMEPLGERPVDFQISSFSALPGSSYVVFASLTYEEDGEAYSSFARGTVLIEEERKLFSNTILIPALILLLMVFLFFQLRGRE
jgi:hypothetical protein